MIDEVARDWNKLASELPDNVLKAEYAKRFITGRPPVLKPCLHCGESFSTREMRAHVPRCPVRLAANPAEIEKARALLAYVESQPAKKTAAKRALKQRPAGDKGE